MMEINNDKIQENFNIDAIFERKIEIGAVIQFNLLQKIIEEFIKRQKSLDDKVNNIEIKLNSLPERPLSSKVTDDNIIKYFNEPNINLDTELKKENETNKERNINPNLENEDKKEITEKNDKINFNKDDKINFNKDDDIDNKKEMNYRQIRILSGRVDKFEKIINALSKKVLNLNDNMKKDENKFDNDALKKQEEKIEKLENDIHHINQTLNEFNLLGYFQKGENKENEKAENASKNNEFIKLFSKKVELIEHRAKQCDEDIFKIKKELTGINNAVSSEKNNYNEFSIETNKNFIEIKDIIKKEINTLKNLAEENNQKTKKDLKDNFDEEIKNLKSMIEEINKNVDNNLNNSSNDNSNNLLNSKFNEKLKNMNNDLKNLINKSASDTEKYLKSIINNLGIENLKKDMSELYQNLSDKLVKTDLDYIDLKLKEFETKLISENVKMESLEKDVNTCNDTCAKSIKMIEYLNSQVGQEAPDESKQDDKNDILKNLLNINEKEIKSFVNKTEFNQEIKKIYKKIEQILAVESENYKFMQYIEKQLKYFVTQNDLKTMEQCISNMLEDIKTLFNKKFMEKTEILKNFKFLEIQIKSIYDNNPGMVKEGENWLLAKKPLNNYLCASCEAFLGDLKNNKNNYLAWNKIPPHENKKYRMGDGFSRMLELVNTDLMKNAEKINNNLVLKIDDKKINYELKPPLPRLGSQLNLSKWNKPNNTFYSNNNDNIEKRLNNSADGTDNYTNKNNNNYKENYTNNNHKIGRNVNNVGGSLRVDSISKITGKKNSPKVLKIVKKTKKDF